MNAGKTKVMVVESMQQRRPPAGGIAAPAPILTCGISTLELVEEFTYLGMVVHARQGCVYGAGARAEKGRKAKSCMCHLCAELGLQSVPVQLCMFDVFVFSVLSNGAEVWTPQLIAAGNAWTATQVHMVSLRSLLGVPRSTPELEVQAEAAQLLLLVRWRTRLARFWNTSLLLWGAVCCSARLQTTVHWRRRWAVWPMHAVLGLGRWQLLWPVWARGSACRSTDGASGGLSEGGGRCRRGCDPGAADRRARQQG